MASLFGLAATAYAEKFVVRFNYHIYTTNAAGIVVRAKDTAAVEIQKCASTSVPALDPTTLETVYDTVANEIQTIKIADGSKVCTLLAFSGGTTLTSSDGIHQVRQAFVYLPTGAEAIGSVSGRLTRAFDINGLLTAYRWEARLQAGVSSAGAVAEGELETLEMFVNGAIHADTEHHSNQGEHHSDRGEHHGDHGEDLEDAPVATTPLTPKVTSTARSSLKQVVKPSVKPPVKRRNGRN